MGKVAASKYSAAPSSSRRFRPPGGASCSHASDPSAETTKLAVSTRQASRARLSVRGAAMENTPRCEFDLEPRQGRCSAGPAFGRAEAAHPRPEPVDPCSTPDGHTAGLPCARWIETRSAVCAKPARKHGADVRGRAGACCRIACGSGMWQRPLGPALRARALRFFSGAEAAGALRPCARGLACSACLLLARESFWWPLGGIPVHNVHAHTRVHYACDLGTRW